MILILSIVLFFLLLERLAVSRNVRSIPHRIHVNGTRGKSSVTRYIAAGLWSEDKDVMSKITGIKPLLFHNGIITEIRRRGMARVQEQFNVIRSASSKNVHSLILECMSITPDLQCLESNIFEPHIYVITNIKDDHREVMGQDIREQVRSICSAIPKNCTVVTTEKTYLEEIKDQAARNGSKVIVPETPSGEILDNLPSGVIVDNISLALEVGRISGEDEQLLSKRILESVRAEESGLRVIENGTNEISFVNAFSANDVDSTAKIIAKWQSGKGYEGEISVILNTRADRPLRTDSFTEWISVNSLLIDKVIITGSHSIRARTKLKRSGIDNERVHLLRPGQISKEAILNIVRDKSMVVGVGNIGEEGHHIIRELE